MTYDAVPLRKTPAQPTQAAHTGRYVMLDSLTILRGPAALIVFCYHIIHDTSWANWLPAASTGYVGVALFFVLSGFVLTWSYKPADGARKFYLRRFARVYPLHLFFFVAALAILVFTDRTPTAGITLSNLFLVQSWIPNWDYIFSVNAVSWSLACEAFFYACTPFILKFLNRYPDKTRYSLLAGWFLLTAAVAGALSLTSQYVDVVVYANPLLRSGEFALGMLLGLLAFKVRDGQLHLPRVNGWHLLAVVLLVLGALYAVSKIHLTQTINGFLLDPLWFLLLGTFALHDLQHERSRHRVGERVPGTRMHRLLVYLGEVSFAFYLVHELVILNFMRASWGNFTAGGARGLMLTAAALVLGLVLAIAAHHLVERPARIFILTTSTRTA